MSSGKWSSDPLKDLEWEKQAASTAGKRPAPGNDKQPAALAATAPPLARQAATEMTATPLSSSTAPSIASSETAAALAANVCPTCKRKLLSTLSVICSWCGAAIDNAEYLERAAKERARRDEAERLRLEAEMEETAKHGVIGRLKKVGKARVAEGRTIDPTIAEAMTLGTDNEL